ncbi:oxygen-insensitive NAD(P)H nitroreductase [Pseudomonas sp.]|uniref:oxygen-insensitive NAD(P)H nitroreductase n=1 Tax=Pseudomonas sp. TaxID=306 RepID=UPI003BB69635
MDLVSLAKRRFTTKVFDADRKIPRHTLELLLEQLRNSPSSVNSQPWHFVVAESDQSRARIAHSTQGPFSFNQPKILNASHVIVFCTRTHLPEEYLQALLAQEAMDGRFHNAEARAGQERGRRGFVDLHRFDQKDLQHWMEKQTYLALGTLLLGAASLGIDATPMEGFDSKVLDSELGLREQGFTSLVVVSLGYHSSEDFNASLPKSRLPSQSLFTFL